MNVKTTAAEQVWQSPDKKRTIWEVAIEDEKGDKYRLKTFSEKIGTVGFEGEVETYQNNRGERMVRQIAKEGAAKGGRPQSKDQDMIRAQWAIGQAVRAVQNVGIQVDHDQFFVKVEEASRKFFKMSEAIRVPVETESNEANS